MASFLSYLIFVEPWLWIIRVMLRVQILLIKWLLAFWFQQVILTHYSPVLIIDTPWKYQKTFRLYWVNVFKSSRFIESLELQWSETDLVSGNRITLLRSLLFIKLFIGKYGQKQNLHVLFWKRTILQAQNICCFKAMYGHYETDSSLPGKTV